MTPAWNFPGEGIELNPVTPSDYSNNWNRFPDELPAELLRQAFDAAWPIGDVDPFKPPCSGHTCHGLYINSVMDASGRILPCCRAPTPHQNLDFGRLDPAGSGADLFNTPMHQSARAYFATGVKSADAPYCHDCDLLDSQHKADIDPTHLGQYAAVHPPFLDAATRTWLSDWTS